MNKTLKQHLSEERLQRIDRAWQYISFWHRLSLLVTAVWWALPTIIEVVEMISNRVNVWITHRLYKAHWIGG
jgi:hypothetical protein